MTLFFALQDFINYCIIKGLQERTVDNYDRFINKFINYIGNIAVDTLSYDKVSDYIMYLHKQDLSKATVATYVRHLKVFIRYLEDEKRISEISNKIKVPKQSKKLVEIYSSDEIRIIFNNITIEPAWLRYRNCAIIALMLDSGLRLNEVTTIDYADYNKESAILKVKGKGDKERLVPVGKLARYYINKYNNGCPLHDEAMFINRLGFRISRNAIKLMISKLTKQLPFTFSAHKLRHNFATNYCINQYEEYGHVDIYKLMILLGHEDIKTTRRYLHLANQIIVAKSNISHLDKVFSRPIDDT